MWRFALWARHAVPLHFPDGGRTATAVPLSGAAISVWNAGILPASNMYAGETPAFHVKRWRYAVRYSFAASKTSFSDIENPGRMPTGTLSFSR
jgi:hypothetical protein